MTDTTQHPPSGAGRFAERWPDLWQPYGGLGAAASQAGDLSARARRLVKRALAVGAGSEGATRSHTRQAREEGIAPADLHQVCLMAITTLGFSAAMAGLSQVDDMVEPQHTQEDKT